MLLSSERLDEIRSKLADYFANCRFPVVCAYLFGSYATGKARMDNDVDIAVLLNEPSREKRIGMLEGK